MSITPNRLKKFRESVRTQDPDHELPPDSSSGQLGPHPDSYFTWFALHDKNDARSSRTRLRRSAIKVTAELVEAWADYTHVEARPMIPVSQDPAAMEAKRALDDYFENRPYDDLEELVYQPRARDRINYWLWLNGPKPRGDAPREVYRQLSRLVKNPSSIRGKTLISATPKILSASSPIDRLEDFLSGIERANPQVFRDEKLVSQLASDILATYGKMGSYEERVRLAFSRAVGIIERHIPGISHAYTVIERPAPVVLPSSNGHGNGATHSPMNFQPFVYRQQNGSNGHRQPAVSLKPQAPSVYYLGQPGLIIGERILVPGAPPIPVFLEVNPPRRKQYLNR